MGDEWERAELDAKGTAFDFSQMVMIRITIVFLVFAGIAACLRSAGSVFDDE